MKANQRMINHLKVLLCVLLLTSSVQVFSQVKGKPELTEKTYSEKSDLNMEIRRELGEKYSLGDWNDLKAIRNIDEWIESNRLRNGDLILLTKDGNATSYGSRHYFVIYSTKGTRFPGYKSTDVIERIGDNLFLEAGNNLNAFILVLNNSRNNSDSRNSRFNNHGNSRDDRSSRINIDRSGPEDRNPIVKEGKYDFNNLYLTAATFPETIDLERAAKKELGNNYYLADWNDLKSMKDIDKWLDAARLKNDYTFMLTKDGNATSTGKRHYFVHYSTTGRPPAGFLVHDKIGKRLFLCSWTGLNAHILVKKNR